MVEWHLANIADSIIASKVCHSCQLAVLPSCHAMVLSSVAWLEIFCSIFVSGVQDSFLKQQHFLSNFQAPSVEEDWSHEQCVFLILLSAKLQNNLDNVPKEVTSKVFQTGGNSGSEYFAKCSTINSSLVLFSSCLICSKHLWWMLASRNKDASVNQNAPYCKEIWCIIFARRAISTAWMAVKISSRKSQSNLYKSIALSKVLPGLKMCWTLSLSIGWK